MIEQTDAKDKVIGPRLRGPFVFNVGVFELDVGIPTPRLFDIFRTSIASDHIEPQVMQKSGKISDPATNVCYSFNFQATAQIMKDRPQIVLSCSHESASMLLIENEFTSQLSLPRALRTYKVCLGRRSTHLENAGESPWPRSFPEGSPIHLPVAHRRIG